MTTITDDVPLAALDPNTVMTALPVLCLALMQNLSDTDAALLGTNLKQVREDTTLTASVKARATVIHLARSLGPEVVKVVIENSVKLLSLPSTEAQAPTAPDPTAVQWVLSDVRESRDATGDPAGG